MSATSTHIAGAMRKSISWSIVLSILLLIAGVLAIVIPPIAGVGITIFVGWLLIFSGVAHLVYGWQTHERRARIWQFLLGIVYLVAGIYLLWNPIFGLVSLTLGLVMYLFAEAALEFAMGVKLRPAPGSGWLFFDSLVTLILAILILRGWPQSSAWVVGTLVGISMIFSGTARLMLSLAARRLTKEAAA
jgi:uncharacterized membrane protein HdeD (DUF308 family)